MEKIKWLMCQVRTIWRILKGVPIIFSGPSLPTSGMKTGDLYVSSTGAIYIYGSSGWIQMSETGDAITYNSLTGKPQLNGITIEGNQSLSYYGIASALDIINLSASMTTALTGKQNNLIAGQSITLTNNGDGTTTISSEVDTELFIPVSVLPDVADAIYNKVYILPADSNEEHLEWIVQNIEGVKTWIPFGKDKLNIDLSNYWTKADLLKVTNPDMIRYLDINPDAAPTIADGSAQYPFYDAQSAVESLQQGMILMILPSMKQISSLYITGKNNITIAAVDGVDGQWRVAITTDLVINNSYRIALKNLQVNGNLTLQHQNTTLIYAENCWAKGFTAYQGGYSFFKGGGIGSNGVYHAGSSAVAEWQDVKFENCAYGTGGGATGAIVIFNNCSGIILDQNDGTFIVKGDTSLLGLGSSSNSGALYLLSGSLMNAGGQFLTISKTGNCPYLIDRFSYKEDGSSLTGTNLNPNAPANDVEQIVTYDNNGFVKSWYRKHSNGYIEQGGYVQMGDWYLPGDEQLVTSVTYPIPFTHPPAKTAANPNGSIANTYFCLHIEDQNTTKTQANIFGRALNGGISITGKKIYWEAKGF